MTTDAPHGADDGAADGDVEDGPERAATRT